MTTLASQSTDIKRILHDPTRGQVVLVSASGVDIYRTSDLTRVAWAVLANITCAAINDYGIYLGTSDTGVWRLPLGALDAASTRLEQVFRPGDSVELSSSSILDIAGTGTALAIISGAEFVFLPDRTTRYVYAGTDTPAVCSLDGTRLAYGTDAGCFVMSWPAANWDDISATEVVVGASGGYALDMDGDGDYALVPDASGIRPGTSDFKITARVKLETGYSGSPRIISKGYSTAGDWALFCNNGYWRFYAYGTSFLIDDADDSPVALDTWQEVEIERVGDAAYLRIDGATKGTITGVDSIDLSSEADLSIGAAAEGASNFFYGQIDYVTMEIGGTAVADWQLDEGGGTTVGDSVGSNTGTIYGNPTWEDPEEGGGGPVIPQAIAFGDDLFVGTETGIVCYDGSTVSDLTELMGTEVDTKAICPSPTAGASAGYIAYGTADGAEGGEAGIIYLAGEENKESVSGDCSAVWIDAAATMMIYNNTAGRYRLVGEISPGANARSVRRDWALYAEITDSLGGMQSGTVALTINGQAVSPTAAAITDGYSVAYTPGSASGYAERVTIELSGLDTDGNTISKIWSFVTASAPAATVTDSKPPNVTCVRDASLADTEADEVVDGINVVWLEDISSPLIVDGLQAERVGQVEIDSSTYDEWRLAATFLPTDADSLATRSIRQGQTIALTVPSLQLTEQPCEVMAKQRIVRGGLTKYRLTLAHYEEV